MLRIARYGLMNAVVVLWIAATLLGGVSGWAVYVFAALLTTVGDEASGQDREMLGPAGRVFYDVNLFATLPLVALGVFLTLGHLGPGWLFDPVWAAFGLDRGATLARTGGWSYAGLLVAGGLILGGAGVNVAHELMHRTGDRLAWLNSRWLLAFTFDTTFAIEHIHGHHRYVCTARDPATARRGEYALAFALRSTVGQFISAFRLEGARLARKGLSPWSPANLALRGQLMSLALLLVAWVLAGAGGVLVLVALGVQGKLYLELVNYVEHYGLVRVPGARVEPRHAWNCYNVISNAILYNLPRHSHHHMFATKPFWALEADADAPQLPFGYKTMIVIALLPPLWRRIVDPLIEDWDRRFASAEELALLRDPGRSIAAVPAE